MYHHSQLQSDKKTADKANCRLSDCFTLKYKFMVNESLSFQT